uniref:Uncharacterized protein n=1 Tax=Musca domestica TaxID=7370 RepID=A0A1I8MZI8_MUSDO
MARKVPFHKLEMILGFGPIVTPKTIVKHGVENCKKLGQNFINFVGPFPQYVTGDPDIVKDILMSKLCIHKDYLTYGGLRHALGEGLLTIQGKDWQHLRKQMDPGFKFSKVLGFLPVFNRRMSGFFEELDGCHAMKDSYRILTFCREYTIGITCETMLGLDLDKSTIDIKHYANFIASMMEYISDVTFTVYYQSKFILKLADLTIYKQHRKELQFLRSVINDAFTYHSTKSGTLPEYVNTVEHIVARHVIEAKENNKIDADLALSNTMHLFGAAFETTSSTLYFAILMLALYPEYQEKAYAEILQMFPENDSGGFEITYNHISQLTYLDMFIKETLRVFPTVPLFSRRVIGGDLRLSNGVVIPEGQEVVINTFNLHRNKDVWGPQADTFNPDNFLPSNAEKRHPYAFVPFAKGLRFCIGLRYAELTQRVAIAKIIKRYKFSTTAKIEDLELQNHISMQLGKYPPITVERRAFPK